MGKGQSKLSGEQIRTIAQQIHFTEKEIRQWYSGFRRDCPNGLLTELGFQKIYKQFFPQGDPNEFASYVFKVYDQDQDGAIDFSEFVHGLSITGRGSMEEKLGWLFRLYDRDKNGAITRQEMESLLTHFYKLVGEQQLKLSGTETIPDRRVDSIWEKLEKETVEEISLADFVESVKADPNFVHVLGLYEGLGK